MNSTVLNYFFFKRAQMSYCFVVRMINDLNECHYQIIHWYDTQNLFSIHRRIISRMNVELVNDISPLYSIVNGDFFPLPPVSRVKPAMFNCTSALWLDEHPSSAENSTCQRFRLRSIYSKDTDCVLASLLGTIR